MSTTATAPATLDGLRAAPCDPLLLAVRLDGRPLGGLTGRVDWRLAGRLSALVADGAVPPDAPLLWPTPDFFPIRRLVLWRLGAATPAALARLTRALGAERPGLCPADFRFDTHELRRAFGGAVVLYGAGG